MFDLKYQDRGESRWQVNGRLAAPVAVLVALLVQSPTPSRGRALPRLTVPFTMIQTIHQWLAQHPITLTFGVGALFFLLSLYSAEIRAALHFWPRKAAHANDRILSMRRLQLLERLHDNTYALVLWLAHTAVDTLIWSIILGPIGAAWLHWSSHAPGSFSGLSIIIGIATGKAFQVRLVLSELANYETSVADIKASITFHEEAEARLAATRKSPARLD